MCACSVVGCQLVETNSLFATCFVIGSTYNCCLGFCYCWVFFLNEDRTDCSRWSRVSRRSRQLTPLGLAPENNENYLFRLLWFLVVQELLYALEILDLSACWDHQPQAPQERWTPMQIMGMLRYQDAPGSCDGVFYIHWTGGTLPTLGGGFLMVTTLWLLRAGRLGVLTIWGDVTEPLAPIFMAALFFPSTKRGGKSKNDVSYLFISFAWWKQRIGQS